jgi:glycosyltransferase involved in cell wall biosynthesis
LALADFAVCSIKPCLSKIASSPTKIGEYLAAGLPIVYNTGIGDLDELEGEGVGVPVRAFRENDYDAATRQVMVLVEDREKTADRCRASAVRHFSLATVGIPRYLRLYAALTGSGTPAGASMAYRFSGHRESSGKEALQ